MSVNISSQMPGQTDRREGSSFDTTPWDLMTVLMHQGMIKHFFIPSDHVFKSVSGSIHDGLKWVLSCVHI